MIVSVVVRFTRDLAGDAGERPREPNKRPPSSSAPLSLSAGYSLLDQQRPDRVCPPQSAASSMSGQLYVSRNEYLRMMW